MTAISPQVGADDRGQAEALFVQGKAHYEANQFQAAIDKFKQAYELAKDPVYLFNIAQSYRNAADCEQAHDYYARYVTEDPQAPNLESVRTWIRELKPCADRIKQFKVRAETQGNTLEPVPVTAPVTVAAPVSSEQTVDRGASLRMIGLATAGVGALGLVAGVVYGVKSQGYENEIATACRIECDWDALQPRHDAGERANTLSLIGYVGGGIALGAGIGLYIFGTTKVERISVSASGDGGSVSARLRF